MTKMTYMRVDEMGGKSKELFQLSDFIYWTYVLEKSFDFNSIKVSGIVMMTKLMTTMKRKQLHSWQKQLVCNSN